MRSDRSDSQKSSGERPSSNKFGAAQGRPLVQLQARSLRGLANRWRKLSDSFAVDSEVLSEKIAAFQKQFREKSLELSSQHKQQVHDLQTEWDEKLDSAIGKTELATLEKIRWENQTLKTLKAKRKDAEAKQESDHTQVCSRLTADLQRGRDAARLVRDQKK